jgi:hypothetical protein
VGVYEDTRRQERNTREENRKAWKHRKEEVYNEDKRRVRLINITLL